jgi:hypothetical protein
LISLLENYSATSVLLLYKWWLTVFCITISGTLQNWYVICHTSFISFCVQWFYYSDFRWSGKILVYSEKLQVA